MMTPAEALRLVLDLAWENALDEHKQDDPGLVEEARRQALALTLVQDNTFRF